MCAVQYQHNKTFMQHRYACVLWDWADHYYFGSYFPFPSMPMSVIAVYSLDYGYGGGLRGDGLVLMSQLNLSHVRNLSG